MKKSLKEIGEREFLSRIGHLVDKGALEFNDDCSAFKLPSGDLLVINVDMLVGKTDVLPGMSPIQIGKKAVTMSISDVITKGSSPIGCLVSVGFPPEFLLKEAEQIILGIKKQCTKYNILFLGGDLNESSDLIVDTITFGLCKEANLIPRKGAKNGDLIYSTGLFGLTSIGYRILLQAFQVENPLRNEAISAVKEPDINLDFIKFLQDVDIRISMDSSDGLSATLNDLSKINNLGIEIDKVPIHPLVRTLISENKSSVIDLVFNGGEEFEIIFSISPKNQAEVEKCAEKLGLNIHKIGSFTSSHQEIKITDSKFNNVKFSFKGYDHFT